MTMMARRQFRTIVIIVRGSMEVKEVAIVKIKKIQKEVLYQNLDCLYSLIK